MDPWTRIGAPRLQYDGYLRVVRQRLQQPDGVESDWDLLDSVDSVVVLPLTPEGRVVCIRLYRPGPDCVVTSLPGGLLGAGETPAAAAARELAEETGYAAASVEVAGSSQWVKSSEVCWSAVARDVRPAGPQRLDPHEDIEVVLMDVAAVRVGLRDGSFGGVAQTYQALDYAGLL